VIDLVDHTGAAVRVEPQAFTIAGYTGRDRAAVQAHIDELAHQGIAPPPEVPMWYAMPPGILTTADAIHAPTAQTCGEVEPVLVGVDGELYLGIGSDHTARDVEREDIARSKAICPKPLGRIVVRLGGPGELAGLDGLALESAIDDEPYQAGSFAQIVPLATLLEAFRTRTDASHFVLFCGTVPLLTHAFRFGTRFRARISGAPLPAPLTLAYDIAGVA
jgi:4-hydroxyphenylacetate 3-monooxygenase